MNKFLDILLPRFITEDVALRDDGDHLVIACALADVKPGEEFPAIATVRNFNLFGRALFPKIIGEPRDWPVNNHTQGTPFDAATVPSSPPLPACPFCGGPPKVIVGIEEPPFSEAPRQCSYGCAGREIAANTFCHECGAEGPKHYDVIFSITDYDAAAEAAAELWTERTNKNGHLYDPNSEGATDERDALQLLTLRKVEQMAAYYEAPKGFFDWLDQQVTLHGGVPTAPEPAGFRIEVTPGTAGEDRT